jgi:hypothetical protein
MELMKMSHHPLADKIIAYSDKYLENAELMFLNPDELKGLSQWALAVQHPLIRDAQNNPANYWGLDIITIEDLSFKASFFRKEDIQYAIDNNLEIIKKFKTIEPHLTYVNPSVDIPVTNEFLTLKVPNIVKMAYQKFMEQQKICKEIYKLA